jgi:hypothetical protein
MSASNVMRVPVRRLLLSVATFALGAAGGYLASKGWAEPS